MNVKLYGFTLTPGNIPLPELFSYLQSYNGDPQTYRKLERIVTIEETPEDWVGLILTARNHKKFCELEQTEDGLKVRVSSVNQKNRLVDFNFFAVRKATGSGIYQHYPNSFGLGSFGYFLGYHNDRLTTHKRQDAMLAAMGQKDEARLRRLAAKLYAKKRLKCTALLKPEDFQTLVDAMSNIKSFSFDSERLVAKEKWFSAAKGEVAREHHSVFFNKTGVLSQIQSVVKTAAGKKTIDRLAVSGLDEDGVSVTYHLGKNINGFGTLDFDSITEDSALDVDNILSSPIADAIIQAMDDHPVYFTQTAKS